jgi:myb proto-oncogene protein
MCSRGHWRPSEDEKLRELVESYGPHNWNAIAENLRGRSGKIDDQSFIIIIH